MGSVDVVEQVQTIASVRRDADAGPEQIRAALADISRVRSWLASAESSLTRTLSTHVSFPEKEVADCTRGSMRDAIKAKERSETLASAPEMADALEQARITPAHVDALTTTAKSLDDDEQRADLFDRVAGLVDVAAVATVDEFRRRLEFEAKNIRRDDGIDRFERQRRATRVRSWTDGEGMVCLSGRFDPVSGTRLLSKLDAATNARFAEGTPDTSPADPIERQQHLAALTLVELVAGTAPAAPAGRPEYVVVIDSSRPDGAGGPTVDWGIPVEVPLRVLADLVGDATSHAVVVRNGVVVHAPGALDLGRSTRLANRAQRRALRALYSTCAIPGCTVRYDRCKLHHIVWWRHGGRTDLANLLPVCAHHHSKIHDAGWVIELGPNRELTLRLPDGSVHNTGPPRRTAA